jgi:hypothetical protein
MTNIIGNKKSILALYKAINRRDYLNKLVSKKKASTL